MTPNPIAMGLILCDYAVIEEGTRKLTLVGEFTALQSRSFPMSPRNFCAYAVLSGGLGHGRIELVVTLLDSDEELLAAAEEHEFTDRLTPLRVLFRIERFSLPAAGNYEFSLLVDGEPITHNRLHVTQEEQDDE